LVSKITGLDAPLDIIFESQQLINYWVKPYPHASENKTRTESFMKHQWTPMYFSMWPIVPTVVI